MARLLLPERSRRTWWYLRLVPEERARERRQAPIRRTPELRAALFQEHLKTAWGTLLLTGGQCHYWFHEGNYKAYLEALFAHWDELTSVGPRLTTGSREGDELMEVPCMIGYTFHREHRLSPEEGRRIQWKERLHEMRARWALTGRWR